MTQPQPQSTPTTWQPSATLATLRFRAKLIAQIRQFFASRQVLEVETPLVAHTSVTDPFIASMPVLCELSPQLTQRYYLQTSPEYAMKRLLAAGSGAIYQISKAFRQAEIGQYHNPEFTMLEWYRPGFDHHQLMDEMDLLLQLLLATPPAIRTSYQALFETYLQMNPHTITVAALKNCAQAKGVVVSSAISDKDSWLNILMTHLIEPQLGTDRPCFVYDFPASQAALARIQPGSPPVAARFEVYFRGIELANGFHELQDATEQRNRFEKNLADREALHLPLLPVDELFLAALSAGLPDCAGVALGIDRLVMLASQANDLASVLSFDFARV